MYPDLSTFPYDQKQTLANILQDAEARNARVEAMVKRLEDENEAWVIQREEEERNRIADAVNRLNIGLAPKDHLTVPPPELGMPAYRYLINDPLSPDHNPLPPINNSTNTGGTMPGFPYLEAGAGVTSGIGAGLATYAGRREERGRIKRQNRLYEEAAARMTSRGRADMMRQNQGASGQLSYMMYRSKKDPQMLEAMRSMYGARVQAGMQMNSASQAAANEMLARRQARPTDPGWDWTAAIGAGLAQGAQSFGSMYGMR